MFCSNCGSEYKNGATVCMKCGVAVAENKQETSVAVRMLVPVGRSGWAIAAGYLAFFSVLIIPAPFALIAGIIALVDIKKHPDKHGKGRAIFGLIMGLLFTSLLLLYIAVGILANILN